MPVEVDFHESLIALYLPPVFVQVELPVIPPHTIISVPVQTVEKLLRGEGTFAPVDVVLHESVTRLYLPPPIPESPPQTIISLPVQTAFSAAPIDESYPIDVGTQVSVPGL
ncbi:MAG TPA: hypothetical protein PLA03_03910 [Acidobacteriota bacterium]|nr:hypothetical protein [Acidobacteriota bacterium]HNT18015.1 hypothetical protein [Acidobacteriota bacterium]HQO19488.1 hypothetical protein [Acidobacteriota bacterium]